MPCPLLRVVLVNRTADELIRTVEALWIGAIGVRRQQGVGQAVHTRRAGTRDEARLAWRILRGARGGAVEVASDAPLSTPVHGNEDGTDDQRSKGQCRDSGEWTEDWTAVAHQGLVVFCCHRMPSLHCALVLMAPNRAPPIAVDRAI